MNILRRLPISRLLLLCALVVVVGVSATALALALGAGPIPPRQPLADAVHGALAAPAVEGVSATVQLTDHLLEGANLASEGGQAGQLASSPLLSGATGRLWISDNGDLRLELQAEKGDTQILYEGHTLSMYDAATNTLYRYVVPAHEGAPTPAGNRKHEPPTVAKIEEAISHLRKHANVSEATPTDIAGQAAYTVRISPDEAGSLLGGAELSWDAVHGVPLRAAIYSSTDSSAVLELAATAISYGAVADSVFEFTPPPGVKIDELGTASGQEHAARSALRSVAARHSAASRKRRLAARLARRRARRLARRSGVRRSGVRRFGASAGSAGRPKLTTSGHGLSQIAVIETKATEGGQKSSPALPASLPQVKVNGATATELATELGTILSFERAGVRYLLVGSVTPAAIEAVARGL